MKTRDALLPLVNITKAFHDNNLDDEARKSWGKNLEHHNDTPPDQIILYQGRGGKTLLTLQDCFNAAEIHADAAGDEAVTEAMGSSPDRAKQSQHLMVMAGDALLHGDRVLWMHLYRLANLIKGLPEVGTEEHKVCNDNVDSLLKEAIGK